MPLTPRTCAVVPANDQAVTLNTNLLAAKTAFGNSSQLTPQQGSRFTVTLVDGASVSDLSRGSKSPAPANVTPKS